LRAAADAVAVGAATLVADDPALTVRDAEGELAAVQPLRVVLVRTTMPPVEARVFTDGAAETLVLDASEGIDSAMRALAQRGVGSVLIEPGPRLLSALWDADALDELVLVHAGGMAGAAAPAAFLGTGDRTDDELLHRMEPVEAGIVGDVAVTVWRPRRIEER
jgi:diaminohydroxyphosphoribosylaminopyrimidine deaminase/5-amino-6-(5-phosphoribosylamino)uracil reductase